MKHQKHGIVAVVPKKISFFCKECLVSVCRYDKCEGRDVIGTSAQVLKLQNGCDALPVIMTYCHEYFIMMQASLQMSSFAL